MKKQEPRISGWGLVSVPGYEERSEVLERLTRDAVLTRGLARSYGDSSLPPPSERRVAATPLADRVLLLDPQAAVLRAEAGLSLRAMNRLLLPRGLYSPITPGTQLITLGGMVAADVHGKNHHVAGTTGRHVRALRVRVGDGRVLECSREREPDLFRATLGGMGLTGHILEVELGLERVPSPWILEESERIPDIDRFLAALKESARAWPHTMGWIDCLSRGRAMGRGILMRGRWATPQEAPRPLPPAPQRPSIPFLFPQWVLNPLFVKLFNFAYYWAHQPRFKRRLVHPESFFYPLDAIGDWNRMYGRLAMNAWATLSRNRFASTSRSARSAFSSDQMAVEFSTASLWMTRIAGRSSTSHATVSVHNWACSRASGSARCAFSVATSTSVV